MRDFLWLAVRGHTRQSADEERPRSCRSDVQFTSATERVSLCEVVFRSSVEPADGAKPRFESVISITAVWLQFKVDRRKVLSVWTCCTQRVNCVVFASEHLMIFAFIFMQTDLARQQVTSRLQSSCLSFLCSTYATLKMPNTKVMQRSSRAVTCALQAVPVCVSAGSTDLSDVERLQPSIFLQDKELVPHPASLHPLEKW